MDRVAIAIKTMDRSPNKNYLGETLRNLLRGGVFRSKHLHSLTIVDGGSKDPQAFMLASSLDLPNIPVDIYNYNSGKRTLHQNAQQAIEIASAFVAADWSLVLEDDLDVCANFLESVVLWLNEHARDDRVMYAFGANYEQIETVFEHGGSVWPYPVTAFYGAQALAWKREDAEQLARWLGPDPFYRNGDGKEVRSHGHDLLLQKWGKLRGLEYFAASAPSFVSHIGKESGIGNRHFDFVSWQGREWSYRGKAVMA